MALLAPSLHDADMASHTPASGYTDINLQHWTLRHLPPWARPYGRLARWDRPIGTWLLMFPCWWSVALGMVQTSGKSGTFHWAALIGWMALFALGAFAMRGAGCTWNDIVDRKIDAQVERTRSRPLPAGEIKLQRALEWLVIQLIVGVAVLFKLDKFAGGIALLSMLLVAIYPTMKRLTSWPQFVLGLAFNWGALVGYASVTGTLSWGTVALYAGGVAWTMVYDTIYAMQDQRDDAIVGVRSTARRFADAPRRWLTFFAVLTMILWVACGLLSHLKLPYFAVMVLIALHLGWQIVTLKPHDQADCLTKFKANAQIGWLLLFAILATPLFAMIR
jgi:4-hydroxybenzoate polyprenyltransferase